MKTEDGQVNTAYRWSNDKSVITMEFSVKAAEDTVAGFQVIARTRPRCAFGRGCLRAAASERAIGPAKGTDG